MFVYIYENQCFDCISVRIKNQYIYIIQLLCERSQRANIYAWLHSDNWWAVMTGGICKWSSFMFTKYYVVLKDICDSMYSQLQYKVNIIIYLLLFILTLPPRLLWNTTEKMHQVRLRHNPYMRTKTLGGQRHTVAWPAGSGGWCARGLRIETRGSNHIISHPISRQIGFSGSGVRVKISKGSQFWTEGITMKWENKFLPPTQKE